MTEPPPTATERLQRRLDDASDAARERRQADVRAALDDVERLAARAVEDESLRERLEHGRAAVDRLVDDEPLVAAEYLDAMGRLVGE